MSRIVVLGDLNLDVHARLPEELARGGEIRAEISVEIGGAAGTFARAAAGFGAAVTLIGAVGEDPLGDLLEQALRRSGVEPRLRRVSMATGVVLALDQQGERGMVCSRGANDGLTETWASEAWERGYDHLHLSGYTLLSDPQREAALGVLERARCEGMSYSVDPPPASLITALGVERFRSMLPEGAWIFPSRSEAELLAGTNAVETIVDRLAIRFPAGAVTLGEDGAFAWAGDQRHRAMAPSVPTIDPTGAGDVYAGVFVASRLAGRSLGISNESACEAASRMLHERLSRRGLHAQRSPSMLEATERMKGDRHE